MSGILNSRRILLGICGGIAAYKTPDLCRRLREAGAEVRVVMTAAAAEFVTATSLQATSGQPVRSALFDPAAEAAMSHIELARWADTILLAPATADTLARLAAGMADDLLSTLVLASDAALVAAPAMNRLMWSAAATQENVARLQARGMRLLGPGVGDQACGETGAGRMLEPTEIVAALAPSSGLLAGKRLLLTAGPTREPLDPVRYISNRSSGKMGYAIAAAAQQDGAAVTLISGPVHLPAPPGIAMQSVSSAEQMHAAVMAAAPHQDIFVATAAVADYCASEPATQKIKKTGETLSLELKRNPDILADLAATHPDIFTLGFAAETHDVARYARDKLTRKKLDMIAANLVSESLGFEGEQNDLTVYWQDGEAALGQDSKINLAQKLVVLLAERYRKTT